MESSLLCMIHFVPKLVIYTLLPWLPFVIAYIIAPLMPHYDDIYPDLSF